MSPDDGLIKALNQAECYCSNAVAIVLLLAHCNRSCHLRCWSLGVANEDAEAGPQSSILYVQICADDAVADAVADAVGDLKTMTMLFLCWFLFYVLMMLC